MTRPDGRRVENFLFDGVGSGPLTQTPLASPRGRRQPPLHGKGKRSYGVGDVAKEVMDRWREDEVGFLIEEVSMSVIFSQRYRMRDMCLRNIGTTTVRSTSSVQAELCERTGSRG